MKRAVILISALFIGLFAGAMDVPMGQAGQKRPVSEIESVAQGPHAKEERIEEPEIEPENSLFAGYPTEIGEKIRSYLPSGSGMGVEKLYNATRDIRTQRLLSKVERDRIDDPEFTDRLIRELAHKYAGGNLVKTVVALHTKAAADWLNDQLITESHHQLNFLKNQATKELISLLRNGYTDSARFLFNATKEQGQPRYLLRFGLRDSEKYNLLIAASRAGDQYIVDRILPLNQTHIDDETREGSTALSEAIAQGHSQIALALLQAGADPLRSNQADEIVDSVLPDAAEENMTEVVHALLADPDVRTSINIIAPKNPTSALDYAVINANYPMFKEILAVPEIQPTAKTLYEAMRRNTQMVADLKKHGVPVNAQFTLGDIQTFPAFGVFGHGENGNLLADDATTRDRLALLLPELLVNVAEDNAISLLIRAVSEAKSKTVELLLNAGAQVDWKDPIHDALRYAKQLTTHNKKYIIKLLEDALAKPALRSSGQKGGAV